MSDNDLEERIAALERELRELRDAPPRPAPFVPGPLPITKIATDGLIRFEKNRDSLTLQINKDRMQQTFPALIAGGGGGGGIVVLCPSMEYMYDWICVEVAGSAPIIIKFFRNIQTCVERVEMFSFCCVTCPGPGVGSSGYTPPVADKWAAPCSDGGTDGENFIYLPPAIFDGFVAQGHDDPIIQITDGGLCYKMIERPVNEEFTVAEDITLIQTCADSSCAEIGLCDLNEGAQPNMNFVNNNNNDFSVPTGTQFSITVDETTITIVWRGDEASGNGDYGEFTLVFTDPGDGNCTVALSHSRYNSGGTVIETVLTGQNVTGDITAVGGNASGTFTIGDLVYTFGS